jgi:hypothetical protein
MIYDVLTEFPKLQALYETHKDAEQALRDHEAKHKEHTKLWQALRRSPELTRLCSLEMIRPLRTQGRRRAHPYECFVEGDERGRGAASAAGGSDPTPHR